MKYFIAAFLFLLFSFALFAQKRTFPINVSVFNEATAIPFTKIITTPIHPGIQLGTEFNYNDKSHSRLFQTANINYFYHKHLSQGIGLYTEFGYEYRLNFGLATQALVGIGYMHTFGTTEEFTFLNGNYIKKADTGNSRVYPSLSFDVGFYIRKNEKNSPKIFIRYQSWAEYPYSPGFIPVMTHIKLHIGTKFFY